MAAWITQVISKTLSCICDACLWQIHSLCQTTSAGEIKDVYRGLLEVLKQAAQTAEGYTEIHSRITSSYLPSWVLKTSEMFNDLQQAISQPRCLSVRVLHDKEYLPAGFGAGTSGNNAEQP